MPYETPNDPSKGLFAGDPRKPYRQQQQEIAAQIAPPPQIAPPSFGEPEPEPEPEPETSAPAVDVDAALASSALAMDSMRARRASADAREEGADSARDILKRGAELYRAAAQAAETDRAGGSPTRPDDLMARRTSALRERLGSSRVFLLYVTRNDHVQQERKLTVRATTMEELIERVREEMDLPESWEFVLCKSAGSSAGSTPSPVPYKDFASITTRAVLQLWPKMLFEDGGESGAEQDSMAFQRAELYRAAVHGDEEAVAQLLEALPRPPLVVPSSPDRDASDDEAAPEGSAGENSALHAAAYYGAVGCLGRFLDAWGNTACNLRNELSQTALHCAARGGQVEAIALLLSAGADVTTLDADDQTPRDVAVHDGHKAAARVLEVPEVEKKATELGIFSDALWERRVESAQATIDQLEARLAENEAVNALRLEAVEDEWRQRLEDQQIRRMEAMEQMRIEYESRAAEQMQEVLGSNQSTPTRRGSVAGVAAMLSGGLAEVAGGWGGQSGEGDEALLAGEAGPGDVGAEHEDADQDGLGGMLAGGGRALRKSLSFRGSGTQ